MRDKQRYMIYIRDPSINKSTLGGGGGGGGVQMERRLNKEIRARFGDLGVASLGTKFRLFQLNDNVLVVRTRVETIHDVAECDVGPWTLIHVAGSASLAKKAIKTKAKDAYDRAVVVL